MSLARKIASDNGAVAVEGADVLCWDQIRKHDRLGLVQPLPEQGAAQLTHCHDGNLWSTLHTFPNARWRLPRREYAPLLTIRYRETTMTHATNPREAPGMDYLD